MQKAVFVNVRHNHTDLVNVRIQQNAALRIQIAENAHNAAKLVLTHLFAEAELLFRNFEHVALTAGCAVLCAQRAGEAFNLFKHDIPS